MVLLGLAGLGLVWLGLTRFGLVELGLAWFKILSKKASSPGISQNFFGFLLVISKFKNPPVMEFNPL